MRVWTIVPIWTAAGVIKHRSTLMMSHLCLRAPGIFSLICGHNWSGKWEPYRSIIWASMSKPQIYVVHRLHHREDIALMSVYPTHYIYNIICGKCATDVEKELHYLTKNKYICACVCLITCSLHSIILNFEYWSWVGPFIKWWRVQYQGDLKVGPYVLYTLFQEAYNIRS